ncbi:MAG: GTP cyclohydrolase I [Deltaproteobacteria bacterium]|nr:GTP cyclohydrolase I [Deltaproteobacteria bacterium]
MAAAIADFLRAAGLDPDQGELAGTPERVARAWSEELLVGQGAGPAELLGGLPPVDESGGQELVIFTGITFTSCCPHHLLPYPGRAHLAFRPTTHLAGFGELARLVRGLGARLVLQETLTAEIAAALESVLGASAAACVIDGWPMCVATRGAREPGSRVRTASYRGDYAGDGSTHPDLRLFLDAVETAGRESAR